MAVKMIFFAQCADWIGKKEMLFEQDGSVPVADLILNHEELTPILEHKGMLRVAVNEEIADFDTEVKDGDEVAIMPPVSGG
jgi:molybdopterin synthase catalytic subunit